MNNETGARGESYQWASRDQSWTATLKLKMYSFGTTTIYSVNSETRITSNKYL